MPSLRRPGLDVAGTVPCHDEGFAASCYSSIRLGLYDRRHAPLPRKAQGAGDLGARMMRALDRATEEAPAIAVGTDIPDLDAAHVRSALSALEGAPIVFGPSCDGGFYLVGLKGALPKGLFDGVPWSSPDTLARSIDSAASLEPALIDTLDDLDDRVALDRHRGETNWDALRR